MRIVFLAALFLHSASLGSDLPSWRSPPPPPSSSSAAVPARAARAAPYPPRAAVPARDTVTVLRVDTVRVVDTVRDTVSAFPAQYRYSIRYALTSLSVEMNNPEWLDYASSSEIVARDTATLKMGVETIRTLGTMVDQYGNRFPQQDIITTGFTIQVFGDRATIEYRGKNSIAVFSGSFDRSGLLVATGEISETGLLGSFFPFSLFFGTGKKRIIIEILREAYL